MIQDFWDLALFHWCIKSYVLCRPIDSEEFGQWQFLIISYSQVELMEV